MTVCFFGAYDPGYPRNRILRRGLVAAGHHVTEARAAERRAWLRYPALVAAFARAARGAEVLLVPEFRHKDVPLARRLKGRRLLVFDPLVSRYDTVVLDWGLHARDSLQARWNRRLDRWAFATPDLVLCDTWAHGERFVELGARRDRVRRVVVGAEEAFFELPPPPPGVAPARILYVGGFLPLHGVPVVLEAVARLERDCGPNAFRVTLVGRGIQFEEASRLASHHRLATVDFAGPTPYATAPGAFASADIVLGAFGTSDKAGRVVPHKVYQGLASGRAVVTGDGAGVRELFTPGVHLEVAPRGDAAALSERLAHLIADPVRRAALGREGRERALEIATPVRVGAALSQALEGGGERMP